MVGDENAQMTVLHGAGGDKAAVLPTTEAGGGSFDRDAGAGQGPEAVTGGGGVLRVSALRYISPDPGHVSLWAHPLGTTREQEPESLLMGHSFCKGLQVCSLMVELLLP